MVFNIRYYNILTFIKFGNLCDNGQKTTTMSKIIVI